MAITYNNIVECLVDSIPEFHPDRNDVADNLVYPVFADLVRFVKILVRKEDQDEVLRRIFVFIEECVRDDDPRVVEMFRDVFIELALFDSDRVTKVMGPSARKLLKRVRIDLYR